jgi:hypothetical protein
MALGEIIVNGVVKQIARHSRVKEVHKGEKHKTESRGQNLRNPRNGLKKPSSVSCENMSSLESMSEGLNI